MDAHAEESSAGPSLKRPALVVLVLLAAVQYAWNAWNVPPLTGYDAGGHAGYILTLVEQGRLPHPMDPRVGWSTFHPPLYYLAGSSLWPILEPIGPRVLLAGLRAISAVASLAAGLLAYFHFSLVNISFNNLFIQAMNQ